ncbi:MAG: amidohydrolase family protein [Chitinophagaceae bacterium]|nr:amidohydrolase family protein [Chitinophagaceae bacterium]
MKRSIRILAICTLCFIYSNLMAQTPSYPIVDSHCHIKTHLTDDIFMTMEEYFAENKSINIKYLFGISFVQRQGNLEEMKVRNDSLFSMARRDSRFIPVCSVHPNDGDAAIEELRRIKDFGGKIIKLHPITQNFPILSNEVFNVARVAGELGLIILIDGYGFVIPNYVEHLLKLAMSNPRTKFIIAHMGGTDFYKLGGLNLVQTLNPGLLSNVWYDLSATVKIYADSPYKSQLEWVIRNIGIDRVLFGTDNPVTSLSEALNAFYKLDFNETEKENILYKNAVKLLRL